MNDRARLCMFVPAALALGALLFAGLHGLPGFGNYPGPYGDLINAVAVTERHVTDMATAVNFDYRGFDTMGEEYILFAAVTGLALLLRQARGEIEDEPREAAAGREVPGPDDAIRWLGLLLTGATIVFGVYLIAHAHQTPGGGFQGGCIVGTACLLTYLAMGYQEFRAISPKFLLDFCESLGAGGYVLIGLATLAASGAFLENTLPLGQTGHLFSAGTIPVINLTVGLEVAAGFVIMFAAFLKDTRKPSEGRGP